MILTVHITNAKVEICVVEDGKRCSSFSLTAYEKRTADEYFVIMQLLFSQAGIDPTQAIGAIVASVVPALTKPICAAAQMCTGRPPMVLGPGVKTGLSIRIDDPTSLGAELAAASVSALSKYGAPCIIIQMQTAIVFSVIDSGKNFIGGSISPGITMGQAWLEKSAAKLTSIDVAAPKKVIGKSTADCMQSGIIFGSAALIDGMLERTLDELGSSASIVATGDWASTIVPHCARQDIVIDNDLVMHGLSLIWDKNR